MAKRGRKPRPLPESELRELVAAGRTSGELRAHFRVALRTLLKYLKVYGIPRPRVPVSHPVRTSEGRTWQALNTPEKLAAINTPMQVAKFWAKVQRGDGCWTWLGAIHKARGYGQFGYGGFNMFAHRASWMINRGVIPADTWVLHKCDNPKCVRPDHLFLGSNQDNYDDRDAKDRVRHGSRHPRAKLNEDLVIQIRTSNEKDSVWAKRLGVHSTAIRDARLGIKWKRVKVGISPGNE